MEEQWKDIYFIENGIEYDYRGLYQVSNLGNIKSLNYNKTKKEKIRKPQMKSNGYLYVVLFKNGKGKNFLIHRLVAHMFCDGYFEGAEVDHINTIRNDNRADNLRWVSCKENNNNLLTLEKYKNKIFSEEHKQKMSKAHKGKQQSKETKKKMSEAHKGSLIERWNKNGTLVDIMYQFEFVELGFDSGHISACCKGRQKSHKGFIFKYHENNKREK